MKKILNVFIFFYMIIGYSQDCKYEKKEIDEFTKNSIIKVKGSDIFRTSLVTGFSFQVSKINDIKYITFSLTSSNPFVLEKGDSKIMLKTKDEQIINIGFYETLISESTNIKSIGIIFYCHQTIVLTDDLINKLKDSEIIKARVYTKNGYIEKEVKKKNSKNISDDLKCLE